MRPEEDVALSARQDGWASRGSFRQCWLAYVDILGYAEFVGDACARPGGPEGVIATLREIIAQAVEPAGARLGPLPDVAMDRAYRDFRPQVRVISDAACLTVETTDPASVVFFLARTAILQAYLICTLGLLVRGAAVLGGHYDDGDVVFSPALIDAVDSERRQCHRARVVVAPEVARRYLACCDEAGGSGERAPAWLLSCLARDDDGEWFVNYLTASRMDRTLQRLVQRHRDVVDDGLRKHGPDPRKGPKWAWACEYHTRFCGGRLA